MVHHLYPVCWKGGKILFLLNPLAKTKVQAFSHLKHDRHFGPQRKWNYRIAENYLETLKQKKSNFETSTRMFHQSLQTIAFQRNFVTLQEDIGWNSHRWNLRYRLSKKCKWTEIFSYPIFVKIFLLIHQRPPIVQAALRDKKISTFLACKAPTKTML